MNETIEDEKNTVVVFLIVEYTTVQRTISFSVYNNTKRELQIGSFVDNQHYINLEALLIQLNPKQEESIFQVHAIVSQIKNQRKKILDKLSEFDLTISEAKIGSGDLQSAMKFLLKKELNMYVKETEERKGLIALQKLL